MFIVSEKREKLNKHTIKTKLRIWWVLRLSFLKTMGKGKRICPETTHSLEVWKNSLGKPPTEIKVWWWCRLMVPTPSWLTSVPTDYFTDSAYGGQRYTLGVFINESPQSLRWGSPKILTVDIIKTIQNIANCARS